MRLPLAFQSRVIVVNQEAGAYNARTSTGGLSRGEAALLGRVGGRGILAPPGGHLFPKLQHRQSPGSVEVKGGWPVHDGVGLQKYLLVLHGAVDSQ